MKNGSENRVHGTVRVEGASMEVQLRVKFNDPCMHVCKLPCMYPCMQVAAQFFFLGSEKLLDLIFYFFFFTLVL